MMKVLPMGKPIVDSYPGYGGGFSILGAHTEKHLPWVYNLFVQIYSPPKLGYSNKLNYAVPDVMKACPWLKSIHIERSIGLEMMNIVDLIKTYINHEYYFFAYFNISQIAAYKKTWRFSHDSLIYGYNDEKEEFYFADNFKYGKYSHGIASYQEIESATKTFDASKDGLGFYGVKYQENNKLKDFQFDKRAYIDLLIDYIEEKESSRHWEVPGTIVKVYQGRRRGIGVYSYVQDYLNLVHEAGKKLDKRGFYVIKEHKLILEKSLTYVLGERWKSEYPVAWQLLEKDINMATIALNLCLKYNVVSDVNILDKIRYYVAELEANDRKLFPCLINILEKD